jgi:predicted O-methyltransferase YrrM
MTDDIEKVRQLTSEIDGWLSDSEGELLYKLAKNVPRGQAIVELGSWKGKSTVWLAKGTEAGQGNKVYSIDPHSRSKAHISEGERNTCPAFLTNLTEAGVQNAVVPLVTTSDKAAKRWRKKVGLLWIDASHEYQDVKHDLLCWKRHLLPGAIVAFHDCDKPGPAQVVEEYLNHSSDFTIIQSVDTTVVAAKISDSRS